MIVQTGISAAVAAKDAVIDRLRAEADGGLLNGVSVDYGWSPNGGLESIYGGGWRTTQTNAVAEQDGLLMSEAVSFALYVRVVRRPPVDVAVTDARAMEIANVVSRIFRNDPRLTGGMTWLGITSGLGDYARTDDETVSVHAWQVSVSAFVTWGT